jgi:hypothetical protein
MKFSGRRRAAAIVVGSILAIYAVVGFFVVPPIVRAQAEKRLSEAIGRKVSVGSVSLNPFALSVTVRDFCISEKDGSTTFVGWDSLYVRVDALASLWGDWVVGAVDLDGFNANVELNKDGSVNFSDILARVGKTTEASGPSAAPHPVRVGRLGVTRASVTFLDRSLKHPFHATVWPLTFSLSGFRTVGSAGAPYHFEATTESGEKFAWSGTLAADPVASQGEFSVNGLVLSKYMPYLEARTGADVTDGRLSLSGSYAADLDPKARTLRLDNAEVHLSGLKIAERGSGSRALELASLDVSGIDADAVAMSAGVKRIAAEGGHAWVRRARDGSLNLLALAGPPGPAAASTGTPAPLPKVKVGEVSARGFTVDVSDQSVGSGASLSLGSVQVGLRDVTLEKGAEIPVHLAFAWAPRGAVSVDGKVTLLPSISADLVADVSDFSLLPLSPYLEQLVNARVTGGSVSTKLAVKASLPGGNPEVAAKGSFDLGAFCIVDAVHNKELAGVERLSLRGIDVATAPRLRASLDGIEVVNPYARVRVNDDGTLNLSSLRVAGSGGAAPAPSGPLPELRVGSVSISGGSFSFTDTSVSPNVRFTLDSFGGTLKGLSSDNPARADLELSGMVGGTGPLEIKGKLDPLGAHRSVDLSIGVRSADLVPLSPYAGKYAGYELARGQLFVSSAIAVNGDAIDAKNVVTLNQFTFGGATGSKDATSLPVRLGVALLKDVDGKIVIDLPVQGTLGDPNFRVGKVVLRVIENLLTKAAVSPFSLVGAMFGGGGEELAFQQFDPGRSVLVPSEAPKLQTLAKALEGRPRLNLGISGGFDAAADSYALKRVKLADLVRRSIWQERHAADPSTPPPALLVISAQEESAMVKKLFDAKFPPGTTFGTPLPPPPAIAPPPPAPRPGLVARILNAITLRKLREDRAAKKESERLAAEHESAVKAAAAAGLPLEEMKGRLAEAMTVKPEDLAALAGARAKAVRDQLVGEFHIPADRLFLEKSLGSAGPRVTLTLE